MHPSPDVLALVALGEDGAATPQERAHLAGCSICAQEVADFTHLAAVGRTVERPSQLLEPAPHVWERVRAELGFTDPPVLNGVAHPLASAPSATPPARRPSRRLVVLAAALALVVGLGVGLGIGWMRQPGVTVLARADLAALPSWSGSSGSATLQRNAAGQRIMTLDLESSRPLNGTEAVWLIDPSDPSRPLFVGLMDRSAGIWSVPATIDVARYRLIDVSEEPPGDTDLTHSGNSIVRGPLTA